MDMNVLKVGSGNKDVVNVFIECPEGSKCFYEYNNKLNLFTLKKVLELPFPGSYGFIPKTHHIDAKQMDVLVVGSEKLEQGIISEVKPIGIIRMKGEIPDDVLIGTLISDKAFENINEVSELENLEEIKRFLENFKGSEVEMILSAEHSKKSIERAIQLHKKELE